MWLWVVGRYYFLWVRVNGRWIALGMTSKKGKSKSKGNCQYRDPSLRSG